MGGSADGAATAQVYGGFGRNGQDSTLNRGGLMKFWCFVQLTALDSAPWIESSA
jgi:hypothetical protein